MLTVEISKRTACIEYGLHWQTLQKVLTHTAPPGYSKAKVRASKTDPFLPVIREILAADRKSHPKQRHTVRLIFERLRDEHGYTACMTLVRNAARAATGGLWPWS